MKLLGLACVLALGCHSASADLVWMRELADEMCRCPDTACRDRVYRKLDQRARGADIVVGDDEQAELEVESARLGSCMLR